jgi:dihydroorotase
MLKVLVVAVSGFVSLLHGQEYDLLLKGGHLIDPKNGVNSRRDVAIAAGRIVAVAPSIDGKRALKTIDVSGMFVAPGFVDIHAHFWGTAGYWLHPDSHTLRAGVTTAVDAGGSGWRNFPEFRDTVIKPAAVRVLAWLNIVGRGMDGRAAEQFVEDMDPKAAAAMIESGQNCRNQNGPL